MYIENRNVEYLGEPESSLLFQSFGRRFRLWRHVIFESGLSPFCRRCFCRCFHVVLQHGLFKIFARSSFDYKGVERVTIGRDRFTRTRLTATNVRFTWNAYFAFSEGIGRILFMSLVFVDPMLDGTRYI